MTRAVRFPRLVLVAGLMLFVTLGAERGALAQFSGGGGGGSKKKAPAPDYSTKLGTGPQRFGKFQPLPPGGGKYLGTWPGISPTHSRVSNPFDGFHFQPQPSIYQRQGDRSGQRVYSQPGTTRRQPYATPRQPPVSLQPNSSPPVAPTEVRRNAPPRGDFYGEFRAAEYSQSKIEGETQSEAQQRFDEENALVAGLADGGDPTADQEPAEEYTPPPKEKKPLFPDPQEDDNPASADPDPAASPSGSTPSASAGRESNGDKKTGNSKNTGGNGKPTPSGGSKGNLDPDREKVIGHIKPIKTVPEVKWPDKFSNMLDRGAGGRQPVIKWPGAAEKESFANDRRQDNGRPAASGRPTIGPRNGPQPTVGPPDIRDVANEHPAKANPKNDLPERGPVPRANSDLPDLGGMTEKDAIGMSDLAYDGQPGQTYVSEEGVTMTIPDGGVREDKNTGFRAVVLVSDDGGIVLSFAGTQLTKTETATPPGPLSGLSEPRTSESIDMADVVTDVAQATAGRDDTSDAATYVPQPIGDPGLSTPSGSSGYGSSGRTRPEPRGVPAQYKQAADLTAEMKAKYGDRLRVTGHSLGGGLANYAGGVNDVPGVGVNSATLGHAAQSDIRKSSNPRSTEKFVHYNNEEIVSKLPGKQLGTINTHQNPAGVGYVRGLTRHLLKDVDPSQPINSTKRSGVTDP